MSSCLKYFTNNTSKCLLAALYGWIYFPLARELSVTLTIWSRPISHQSCLFCLPVCFHVVLGSSCSDVWAVCCLQYLPFQNLDIHYAFPFFLLLFWIILKVSLIHPTGLTLFQSQPHSWKAVSLETAVFCIHGLPFFTGTLLQQKVLPSIIIHTFSNYFFPHSICTYTYFYSSLFSDYTCRSYSLSVLLSNIFIAEFHIMGADELFH